MIGLSSMILMFDPSHLILSLMQRVMSYFTSEWRVNGAFNSLVPGLLQVWANQPGVEAF